MSSLPSLSDDPQSVGAQARLEYAVRASLPSRHSTASTQLQPGEEGDKEEEEERRHSSTISSPGHDTAIRKFNLGWKRGIAHLRSEVFADFANEDDTVIAEKIASFLRHTEGLDRGQVGEALGMHDEFSLQILHHYCASFDFAGLTFEQAFRAFLEAFRLPGESQKIERILTRFSQVFVATAGDSRLVNEDAVMVLAYATLMLNVSLHNPKLKERDRMTRQGFLSMLRGCDNGADLPPDLLDSIFASIEADGIMASDNRSDLWGNLFVAPEVSGWLLKKSSSATVYKRRWIVLTRENQLFYFDDRASAEPIGFIDMSSATVEVSDNKLVLRPLDGEKYVKSVRFQAKKQPKLGSNTHVLLKMPPVDRKGSKSSPKSEPQTDSSTASTEESGTKSMELQYGHRHFMQWYWSLQQAAAAQPRNERIGDVSGSTTEPEREVETF